MSPLNRRKFLIAAAAGSRVLRAQPPSGQTFLAGLVPGRSGGGYGSGRGNGAPSGPAPLTTPASPMDRFWQACDECSTIGVHHIEVNTINTPVAQTYDTLLGKFKDEMAKRNVRLLGLAMYAHWQLTETRQQMIDEHLRVARFLKAVGGKYIAGLIAPAAHLGNGDEESYRRVVVKDVVANCNAISKQVHEETGIGFGYHPEQGDLRAGMWSHIVEDTDPRYFHFWPDVGHLVACGLDPLEVYKKYRSRMIGTHLRDFVPAATPTDSNGQPSRGRMVAFGQGIIKLPDLVAYLRETKFTGCVMGEGGGGSRAMRDYMVETLGLKL
jgi:sugar phosphate isomerase/epimerase